MMIILICTIALMMIEFIINHDVGYVVILIMIEGNYLIVIIFRMIYVFSKVINLV